ncbi:hypothetical protein HPB50_025432 [Hyalomma asiaticum]|uniref:Uncharacterized protein n=1 Tax=Hyalomma asiaticum TaxID=266040 RepID=A0ACB7SN59_HYAAI|nr:hypothetical protein HPB50_025432 [Hyalomma asiaticum]
MMPSRRGPMIDDQLILPARPPAAKRCPVCKAFGSERMQPRGVVSGFRDEQEQWDGGARSGEQPGVQSRPPTDASGAMLITPAGRPAGLAKPRSESSKDQGAEAPRFAIGEYVSSCRFVFDQARCDRLAEGVRQRVRRRHQPEHATQEVTLLSRGRSAIAEAITWDRALLLTEHPAISG